MFFSGKDHEVKWSVQDVVSRRDTLGHLIIYNRIIENNSLVMFFDFNSLYQAPNIINISTSSKLQVIDSYFLQFN